MGFEVVAVTRLPRRNGAPLLPMRDRYWNAFPVDIESGISMITFDCDRDILGEGVRRIDADRLLTLDRVLDRFECTDDRFDLIDDRFERIDRLLPWRPILVPLAAPFCALVALIA